jgi:alpha-galactosidase
MSVKISIVGAGSAVFSLNLIKDLCLTPRLSGSTVMLMDIDEERLDAAFRLCSRYALEAKTDLVIEKTTRRSEALAGADFVVHTALEGGHEKLRDGWRIAYEHGYRFGGSLHVVHDEAFWVNFHQLQLMDSIAEDMLSTCPEAWLVLVANPVMAGVTHLSRKVPALRLVGMCHGYAGVYEVAKVLGLERSDISFQVPGVNHFVWLTDLRCRGEDALPLLDEWVRERSSAHFETCGLSSPLGPKAVDLYRRFGAFPIGDTGNPGGGSWGYWYHSDDATEALWKEDPKRWYDDHFRWGLGNVEHIRSVARDEDRRVMDAFPAQQSDEPMVPLIEALACDVERAVIVNIPNEGDLVPGVPRGFAVEVPALVSGRGIQGIRTKGLPGPLRAALLRDRVAPVETELYAYEHRDRGALLSLLLMDPWTRSDKQARALLDAILSRPYGQALREHYR